MDDIKLTADGRIKLPQPQEISKREKEDAMGAYFMMFATWGLGLPLPLINLIAAVIYFALNKKKSRFVAFHSYQSLITQIPVSLLNAGLIIWTVHNLLSGNITLFNQYFFVYLFFVIFWNIIYTIFSIIGAVKAKHGQFYYILFFGILSFNKYYGSKAQTARQKMFENRPPKGF